ncbi:MAG: hypothetical protein EHM70_05235 [Chloroflexota bacterium]|nr:MAG: hypothetical protein EHM70_05235 [Chloroflexota bacterium]
MAGRNSQDGPDSPGSRQRDLTVDDALLTMERLAAWLELARQENAWQQTYDQLQVAILHGMLVHLRQSIDELLALGGEEVAEMVENVQTLTSKET